MSFGKVARGERIRNEQLYSEAMRRKLLRAASLAHQALALGSLLALLFLIPSRAPGSALGSRFRDYDRVPVRIQPMLPAGLIAAAGESLLPPH